MLIGWFHDAGYNGDVRFRIRLRISGELRISELFIMYYIKKKTKPFSSLLPVTGNDGNLYQGTFPTLWKLSKNWVNILSGASVIEPIFLNEKKSS